MDGEEIKDFKTLAKLKTVDEMLPKPHMGTNTVIGEEQYRIIEDTLRLDGTIEEACTLAGISVPSYYKHREKNPDFARRMDMARQFPKLVARAAVQRRIRQGDSRTALEFLKLRDKKRYNAVPGIDEEGGIATAARVQFISIPSEEGADPSKNDSQTPTNANSASDSSANSLEKQTPRENEEQVLKNMDYLTFSSE